MLQRILTTAKLATISFLVALLASCGGGGEHITPLIYQHQASTLQYGKTAVIYISGTNMHSGMTATSGNCTSPSFSSQSTPTLAVLNCKVTKVGDVPISIQDSDGKELYAVTLTVPKPQVMFITSQGTIFMDLEPDVVPTTVNNFLSYVNSGFYRSTLFHRVIPGFVIQAGGFTTGMVQKTPTNAPIALESNRGLRNTRSTVAMARTSDPNSATSQFFINLVDNASADYQSESNPGYAVFGTVVQGMDVVDKIAAIPTATSNGFTDVPTEDVTITLAIQTK